MQAASCARLDLLPVLSDDVHKGLSYNSVSCNEQMDVLAALPVKEFVMDGPDGRICV